jgi:hypothetical protein
MRRREVFQLVLVNATNSKKGLMLVICLMLVLLVRNTLGEVRSTMEVNVYMRDWIEL